MSIKLIDNISPQ